MISTSFVRPQAVRAGARYRASNCSLRPFNLWANQNAFSGVAAKAMRATSAHYLSTDTSAPSPQVVEKNILKKMWDKHSIAGQQNRIHHGQALFQAAKFQAKDSSWFIQGRIPNDFRSRHAILTMHIWFLQKRLILDKIDPHTSTLVQEELFETFWSDTRCRIRAEGLSELTLSKHLKDVQQYTFEHCMHYDHAFTFDDPLRRREEIALAVWTHVLRRSEETYDDLINRLALYVEWQYNNIMTDLPNAYFREGRINWGYVPDFSKMKDNKGEVLDEVLPSEADIEMILPAGWQTNLTESGDLYYWNEDTMESSWDKPS